MIYRVATAALFLFCFASASVSFAQTSTGTIVGQVEDSSGAPMANVEVKLVHVATGSVRETHTNDTGSFNAPVIPPGSYSITVTSQGFATKTLTGINLLVDQTLNLHITMEVGLVGQSVEVVSAEPLVDSVTSSLGQGVGHKKI